MCRFTRLVWTECGHSTILTTPEHTLLCSSATGFTDELIQGIHRAPPDCYPLLEDIGDLGLAYASKKIVQTQRNFSFCDACKSDPEVAPETKKVGTPIISEAEFRGTYSDDELSAVEQLKDLHLSGVNKAREVMQTFDSLLSTNSEPINAAVMAIRNQAVRDRLVRPGLGKYDDFFTHTLMEVDELLTILDLYMKIQVPEKMFSELYELVRNKLYQADARYVVFCDLVDSLREYEDDKGYEARINRWANKLAVMIGKPPVADANSFAHLIAEEPVYAQKAVEMKEFVRKHFVKGKESVATGPYKPRSSFGLVRNKHALGVNTDLARKPPPGTKDIPQLRALSEFDFTPVEGSDTRKRLNPLGIGEGPWGIRSVLDQNEGQKENDDTLVESFKEEKTNSDDVMFMGGFLHDTDSEVSVNDGEREEEGADRKIANRDSILDTQNEIWGRDSNGRLVKKRKCSA